MFVSLNNAKSIPNLNLAVILEKVYESQTKRPFGSYINVQFIEYFIELQWDGLCKPF